jgi:Ni,Fe-hydrogenase III small subunit
LGVSCACCAGVFDCALTVVTPYSIIIPVTVVVTAVPVVIPEHSAAETEKAER